MNILAKLITKQVKICTLRILQLPGMFKGKVLEGIDLALKQVTQTLSKTEAHKDGNICSFLLSSFIIYFFCIQRHFFFSNLL